MISGPDRVLFWRENVFGSRVYLLAEVDILWLGLSTISVLEPVGQQNCAKVGVIIC